MAVMHPDFSDIQQRLRRLDPSWYPAALRVDDEYGPAMARGIDAALDMLERAKGLPPFVPTAAPTASVVQRGVIGRAALQPKFHFLLEEPLAPLMVRLAIDFLGLLEVKGPGNNPTIVGWADEVAASVDTPYSDWAADWYNADSIAHCGLFMAMIACRAAQGNPTRLPPTKYLAALEWRGWGEEVDKNDAAVGDVMVMKRDGGGHVTLNVGTEVGGRRFFGLGSNQSDAVTIAPFDLARVVYVGRPPYKTRPAGSRRVIVGPGGPSSTNEG